MGKIKVDRTLAFPIQFETFGQPYPPDLEIVQGLSGNPAVQAKKFLPICVIFDIFKSRTYLTF